MKACKFRKNIVLIYFLSIVGITSNMSFAQLESEVTTFDTPNKTLQNSTNLELEPEISQAQEEQVSELESLNPLAFFRITIHSILRKI